MRKLVFVVGLAIVAIAGAFALVSLDSTSKRQVIEYDFITLDLPRGSFGTRILGINDHADVVGHGAEPLSGFLYKKGTSYAVRVPSSSFDQISAINNSGVIAGSYVDSVTKLSGAFVYRDEKFTILDHPAARYSYAYGINDRGDVVGFYVDDRGSHGFHYADNSFFDLDFPGVFDSRATGINNKGRIVGFYLQPKDKRFHGFIYDNGVFTELDYPEPDVFHTRLQSINDRGDIVGFCSCGPHRAAKGFLFRDGKIIDIQFPQAAETFPNAINNHGLIVGFYNGADGGHGFYAAPRRR